MPLIEAAGTSVDKMSPDSVKNSTPPERIWLSVSVSDPSWLDGKICISKRPPVCSLIAAAIARACTFIGCVSGRLLAYLYDHCACWARATNGAPTIPAKTTEAPLTSSSRRDNGRDNRMTTLPGEAVLSDGSLTARLHDAMRPRHPHPRLSRPLNRPAAQAPRASRRSARCRA